jgi:hypothetical protein
VPLQTLCHFTHTSAAVTLISSSEHASGGCQAESSNAAQNCQQRHPCADAKAVSAGLWGVPQSHVHTPSRCLIQCPLDAFRVTLSPSTPNPPGGPRAAPECRAQGVLAIVFDAVHTANKQGHAQTLCESGPVSPLCLMQHDWAPPTRRNWHMQPPHSQRSSSAFCWRKPRKIVGCIGAGAPAPGAYSCRGRSWGISTRHIRPMPSGLCWCVRFPSAPAQCRRHHMKTARVGRSRAPQLQDPAVEAAETKHDKDIPHAHPHTHRCVRACLLGSAASPPTHPVPLLAADYPAFSDCTSHVNIPHAPNCYPHPQCTYDSSSKASGEGPGCMSHSLGHGLGSCTEYR